MSATESAPESALDTGYLTLAEVRTHLNLPEFGSGILAEELAGLASAACSAIEDLIGPVGPTVVTEVTADPVAVLPFRPIVSVDAIDTAAGSVDPALVPVDLDAGIVYLSPAVGGACRVTFTAGRVPIPGNVRLATLELLRHLYGFSQSAARGRFGGADDEGMFTSPTGYAMPNRVRELLGHELLKVVL